MKKTLIVLMGLILFGSILGVLCFKKIRTPRPDMVLQSIDNQGVFVGDKKSVLASEENPGVQQKLFQEQEEHQANLRVIDDAWDNIGFGNEHFKAGYYEEAALAYKKAYSVGETQRHVSGMRLARTYEKLGRFDDGVAVLDGMIKNGELSEKGVEKAQEIRARLLAAKNNRK